MKRPRRNHSRGDGFESRFALAYEHAALANALLREALSEHGRHGELAEALIHAHDLVVHLGRFLGEPEEEGDTSWF
jgi:hypothetical protein